jgi:hypothetical protein
MARILLSSLATLIFSSVASLAFGQALLTTHHGNPSDRFGYSLAPAGDIDGDGTCDLVIGSQFGFDARVVSGDDGALLRKWSSKIYAYGWAVAGVGDVDGDGRDDVAVGSPGELGQGAIYLYSGKTGLLLRRVEGFPEPGTFGSAIAGAGDVDGDGGAEVAIGAPNGGGPGRVYVYSYASDQMIRILIPLKNSTAGFGTSLANAGDVDGDGRDDLLVGSPLGTKPVAELYSGATGFPLRTYVGSPDDPSFGKSVASLGLISTDGQIAIAVGDPEGLVAGLPSGTVRVFAALSGALIHELHGTPFSNYGTSISTAGDFNGDGFRDFVVGAPGEPQSGPPSQGKAYVHDGPSSFALHVFASSFASDGLGTVVASLGSVDGDPYGDLAIAAPYHGDSKAGAVFVHQGLVPCGEITTQGPGCMGSLGFTPQLDLEGCARTYTASPVTLSITKGPHFATTALLFVGAGNGQLPLHPTCQLTVGTILSSPLALPMVPAWSPIGYLFGSGKFIATGMLPAAGSGVTIHLQALVIDPGVARGFSATNRVTLKLLP